MFLLPFFDKSILDIDMGASMLDKEAAMRIPQAVFGACVAAALVFGAYASPTGRGPVVDQPQLMAMSVEVLGDRLLSAALDAAGEIEARIRQF